MDFKYITYTIFSQPMSVTKALGTLNLVSARGLDNGTAGALALANQESFCKYKHYIHLKY